jgi:hypothetical protein
MLIAPCTLVLVVCTRIVLVMDRRRRTGKIVDLVDLEIDRKRHVVPDELEMLVIEQGLDVRATAGKEIVKTNNICAAGQQALTQMRTEKSGTAGDKDALLQMHFFAQLS